MVAWKVWHVKYCSTGSSFMLTYERDTVRLVLISCCTVPSRVLSVFIGCERGKGRGAVLSPRLPCNEVAERFRPPLGHGPIVRWVRGCCRCRASAWVVSGIIEQFRLRALLTTTLIFHHFAGGCFKFFALIWVKVERAAAHVMMRSVETVDAIQCPHAVWHESFSWHWS